MASEHKTRAPVMKPRTATAPHTYVHPPCDHTLVQTLTLQHLQRGVYRSEDAARTAASCCRGTKTHDLRTTHLVVSLGLIVIVVLVHIDGVVRKVHIHRWIRLGPAVSLVYGRSAARAAAPGRGHARGVAVWCRCWILPCTSAFCGVCILFTADNGKI